MLVWPGLVDVPFQGLKPAVTLVFCDGIIGNFEPLARDEWGDLLSYERRYSMRPGNGVE